MKQLTKLSEMLHESHEEIDPIEAKLEELNEKFKFDVGSFNDPGSNLDLNDIKKQIVQFKTDHSGKAASVKEIEANTRQRYQKECIDLLLASMPQTTYKYSFLDKRSLTEFFHFKVEGDQWSESFTLRFPEVGWEAFRAIEQSKSQDEFKKIMIDKCLNQSNSGGYINYGSTTTPFKSSQINRLVVLGEIAAWTQTKEFEQFLDQYYTAAVDIYIKANEARKQSDPSELARQSNELINSYVMASFARNVRNGTVLDIDNTTVKADGNVDTEEIFGIRKGGTKKVTSIKVDRITGRFANISITYTPVGYNYENSKYEDKDPYTYEEKIRIEFLLSFFINHSVQGKSIREDKDLEKLSDSRY